MRVGKMSVSLLEKTPVLTGTYMYMYTMRYVHIYVTRLNVSCDYAEIITLFATDERRNEDVKGLVLNYFIFHAPF